jgi:hypothetical protein
VAGFCWSSLVQVDDGAEEVYVVKWGGKAKDNEEWPLCKRRDRPQACSELAAGDWMEKS